MSKKQKTKIQAEIDKIRAVLAEQQNKLKVLEAKHTELENLEIVEIVRGLHIPLENLAEVLQSVKSTPLHSGTSGRVVPKCADTDNNPK